MIASFKAQWDARSLREQRMLMGLGAVVVLMLIWFLIVSPLLAWREAAVERYADAAEDHALVTQALGGASADAPGATSSQALELAVRQSAEARGVVIVAATPGVGGSLTASVERAAPTGLFAWVADVEQGGAAVRAFSATENADATLQAQITFAGGGS